MPKKAKFIANPYLIVLGINIIQIYCIAIAMTA